MTFVIAEAGVNHNGCLDRALQMIDLAAEAGADAVKFQTFKAEKLVAADTGMAAYQEQQLGKQITQLELLQGLELSPEAHAKMQAHCKLRNIEFMSTAFDSESLILLADEIKLGRFKISSGDMNNAPFVLQHARLGKDLIISTGMSTLDEIEQILGVVAFGLTAQPQAVESESVFRDAYASSSGRDALREKVTLLHCSTEYPVPLANINLAAMQTLAETFGTAVGYSDHSTSLHVGGLAVAAGATLIEKHFTTDRSLPGPDHAVSLTPEELTVMIENIRFAEKVYGSKEKRPSAAELKNSKVARKVICASCDIKKGEQFSQENLTFLRSGEGVSPIRYWEFCRPKRGGLIKKAIALTPGNERKKLFILGCGGHASVVADVLNTMSLDFNGFIAQSIADKDLEKSKPNLLSEENFLKNYTAHSASLINGIGMLPKSTTRMSVFASFNQAGFSFAKVVHPKATISSTAVIGAGAQVFAGCVIQPYVQIGDQAIINTAATIDHATKIGSHSHIAPGVTICGNVVIGEGCFIGAGATIVNNVSVSSGAVVKAGEVVAWDI